jgi:nucleoside-diphosphate-sugar epimerase
MTVELATVARRYAGLLVLITGGAGFIGTHLARRLVAMGARVTIAGRSIDRDAYDETGIHAVRADVRDAAAVASLLARDPAVVFHLAGYSGQVPSYADHSESLATNCLGLLNVLDAVRASGTRSRVVFTSSRLVYGRTRYLPVDEDHPLDALSLYGIHKRTGEEYCAYYAARWGVDSIVLRLANPYGPHDPAGHNRYNVANWMIDELIAGRDVTVYGRGEQLRDYIYIDDAIDALLLAGVTPHLSRTTRSAGEVNASPPIAADLHDGQSVANSALSIRTPATSADARVPIYNVGSGVGTPLIDFVEAVIGAAGSGAVRTIDWPADALAVETGDFAAGIARIERDLRWRPRTALAAGIATTVAAQRGALATTADVAHAAGTRRTPARRATITTRRGSQPPPAVPAQTRHRRAA